MIDNSIKDSLHNIYNLMPKESLPEKGDGWVRQDEFAKEVRKARINFRNMGYTWFNEFLKDSGVCSFLKQVDYLLALNLV